MAHESDAEQAKEKLTKELSQLSEQIDSLRARLDEGDFLSRAEVSSLSERLGRLGASAVSVASW